MVKNKIRDFLIYVLGITLFIAISMMFKAIFPYRHFICIGYIVMAICLYSFGTFRGTIVGVIGIFFYCIATGNIYDLLGWSIANVVIGFNLGISFQLSKALLNTNKKLFAYLVQILTIAMSSVIGIILLKSIVEMLLFTLPFTICVAVNLPYFIASLCILIISLPICVIINKLMIKYHVIEEEPY